MADENKDLETKEEETKLSFKTADELTTFLMDMQGQISNLQQTIDKIQPKEDETPEETTEETKEETTEEPTEEEISEVDKLLQGN